MMKAFHCLLREILGGSNADQDEAQWLKVAAVQGHSNLTSAGPG